jgi:tetratricopeptide (TPR) repeat protein
MIKRIQLFLGPTMGRVLVAWLALTGLASLVLNSFVYQIGWVRQAQSLIVVIFLIGVLGIVLNRLSPEARRRWVTILVPAIIAVFLALWAGPQLNGVLIGGAFGWIVAVTLLGRSRMPVEYRQAIKHMRKNEYAEAIEVMNRAIRAEPVQPGHYRFRAELYRLWGKLNFALRDYQEMVRLDPTSPIAYNGLAEIYLQSEDYRQALQAASKAKELAPNDWVTHYNLGMIEDRLQQSGKVIEHLNQSLELKVKDSRHRLLIHLYLLRAHVRLGNIDEAANELESLKRHAPGLEEWQGILSSDQAVTLRQVIGKDVELAGDLITDGRTIDDVRQIVL